MRTIPVLIPAVLALTLLCSCSGHQGEEAPESVEFDALEAAMAQTATPDLRHYELVGPVKSSTRTTYYALQEVDGQLQPDTASTNKVMAVAYFDEAGGYVSKKDERIRRDNQGRITRWEDRHPNYSSIHPGFLKDTLAYTFESDNVMRVTGKKMETVVVTNPLGFILGQHTHSTSPRYDTTASNIYRKYDSHGNWTERLTVWTTRTEGDSIPSVRYSIDRRRIIYY